MIDYGATQHVSSVKEVLLIENVNADNVYKSYFP